MPISRFEPKWSVDDDDILKQYIDELTRRTDREIEVTLYFGAATVESDEERFRNAKDVTPKE